MTPEQQLSIKGFIVTEDYYWDGTYKRYEPAGKLWININQIVSVEELYPTNHNILLVHTTATGTHDFTGLVQSQRFYVDRDDFLGQLHKSQE